MFSKNKSPNTKRRWTSFFKVTFWFPKWRSRFQPWKGHLWILMGRNEVTLKDPAWLRMFLFWAVKTQRRSHCVLLRKMPSTTPSIGADALRIWGLIDSKVRPGWKVWNGKQHLTPFEQWKSGYPGCSFRYAGRAHFSLTTPHRHGVFFCFFLIQGAFLWDGFGWGGMGCWRPLALPSYLWCYVTHGVGWDGMLTSTCTSVISMMLRHAWGGVGWDVDVHLHFRPIYDATSRMGWGGMGCWCLAFPQRLNEELCWMIFLIFW